MTADDVILALLDELISEWEASYSVEEVACDEHRARLMIMALAARGNPTPRVREFYRKVFLRDEWDQGARRPDS